MVESTIDKIKDITVERQIRKLAGIIDEQNDTIANYGDATTDINNLKDSDANQTNQINNLKSDVAKNTTATENLNNRVTTVEQDITNTESEITSVKAAITDIQSKDVAQDGTLATHSEQIQGITESLISDVQIIDGTTTGQIKVRIDRKSVAPIDSNSYNLGLPVSAEIIQGTGPSMFKVQITMSSGVKVVSNDFVFTTEAIGNDVYISSFTFKAGNQDGYLSADIGLNNGVTIEANNFLVPTDPNVIANITNLQTRITAIETKNTEQDTAIQKNATDISSLNSEVSGVMSDLDTKVAISQGTSNAGKVLGIDSDGNVTPTEVSAGGESWEELDTSNLPTDFAVGDRIKAMFWVGCSFGASNWSSTPTTSGVNFKAQENSILEFTIEGNTKEVCTPIRMEYNSNAVSIIFLNRIYGNLSFNSNLLFSLNSITFNGGGMLNGSGSISRTNAKDRIYKMWRLKK